MHLRLAFSFIWALSVSALGQYNPNPSKPGTFGKVHLQSVHGDKIVKIALSHLGTPYAWGGNDLAKGIDSTHFVTAVLKEAGIAAPNPPIANQEAHGKIVHWKTGKARRGKTIITFKEPTPSFSVLEPGDRIIIQRNLSGQLGSRHTGIYIGPYNGKYGHFDHAVVHASVSRGVTVTDLTSSWLWKNYRYSVRDQS